jgi:hypothetical protein
MPRQKDTNNNKKLQDLEINREDGTDQFLITNQGLRINDNQFRVPGAGEVVIKRSIKL